MLKFNERVELRDTHGRMHRQLHRDLAQRMFSDGQVFVEHNGELLSFADIKPKKNFKVSFLVVPDRGPKEEKQLHEDSRKTTFSELLTVIRGTRTSRVELIQPKPIRAELKSLYRLAILDNLVAT